MRLRATLIVSSLLALPSAHAQQVPPNTQEITNEPHHTLLLQNDDVRVFRLKLQPGEATLPHRHQLFYAYLSLRPVTIANEVRGREPVLTQLEAGELHTSKGGFTVAERNNSQELAEIIVIEVKKSNGAGFTTPMPGFRFHNSAFSALYEGAAMRCYSIMLLNGGLTDLHTESYDSLIVALADLKFRETNADGTASAIEMKAGDTRWVPRGVTHAFTNTVPTPATYVALEFN